MQYKINQAITVRYLAIDNEAGLTDLKLTPTNPSGIDQSLITFIEIGDGLYTVNFTPNAIGWWLVKVSSLTKPKNIYSKSYFVGTDYTTYPPQEDGKLTSIDTKLGEVQASPTTYTLLARLKDIYEKLVEFVSNGLAKVKIWDGTNQAQIDSQGRLKVSLTTALRTTVDLFYENASLANYVVNMWRSLLQYTVPIGYNFELINFISLCGSLAGSSRISALLNMGDFNINTNTFADGSAYSSPGFASSVEAEITTLVGASAVILTITYTNQDGIVGRTGTINITASAPIGYRFKMTLQTPDIGIRDITTVSDNVVQVGVVKLYGIRQLYYERNNSSDFTYVRDSSRESIILEEGNIISLEITGTNTTNTRRLIKALGLLVPI